MAVLLTGCASPTNHPNPTETSVAAWVEPAWMAEARQVAEANTKAMVACLAEAGWEVDATPAGSYRPAEKLTQEQTIVYLMASGECRESVNGDIPERTEADWRTKYAHALDTRDCLVAAGYTITDPPSEDSWIAAGLAEENLWAPFRSIVDQINNGTLDMDEQTYYELYAACPQDGPTVGMSGW